MFRSETIPNRIKKVLETVDDKLKLLESKLKSESNTKLKNFKQELESIIRTSQTPENHNQTPDQVSEQAPDLVTDKQSE